jgi:hypothetical protein
MHTTGFKKISDPIESEIGDGCTTRIDFDLPGGGSDRIGQGTIGA